MAKTWDEAYRQPGKSRPSIPGTFANRCRRTNGRCRGRAPLFDESSRWLCRRSSPGRCRFYREDAAEEQASAPKRGTPEPCQIAKSPGGSCRLERSRGEKSSWARQAEADSPCVRRISWCARRDRNRSATSRWRRLRLRLRFSFSPRRQPWKRANSGAVNQGIRGVYQRMVFVIGETKPLSGQVAAKNAHPGAQVFEELRKCEVELEGSPKAQARFLFGSGANQEIQLVAVPGEESRGKITAQVAGRAGYEDRHKGSDDVAAWESAAPCAGSPDQSSARGTRDSSGRPSING